MTYWCRTGVRSCYSIHGWWQSLYCLSQCLRAAASLHSHLKLGCRSQHWTGLKHQFVTNFLQQLTIRIFNLKVPILQWEIAGKRKSEHAKPHFRRMTRALLSSHLGLLYKWHEIAQFAQNGTIRTCTAILASTSKWVTPLPSAFTVKSPFHPQLT